MQFSTPDGAPSPDRGAGPYVATFPSNEGPEYRRFDTDHGFLWWLAGFSHCGRTLELRYILGDGMGGNRIEARVSA